MTESNDFGFPETSNERWNNLSSENRYEGNFENFEFCGNSFFEGHRVLEQIALSKKKQPQQHTIHKF